MTDLKHALLAEGWGLYWEPVIEETSEPGPGGTKVTLQRAKVPGGWVVRTVEMQQLQVQTRVGQTPPLYQWVCALALAFVPQQPTLAGKGTPSAAQNIEHSSGTGPTAP